MAFRGTFDYSLDAKNRLTVPAKFRASLSEGVVLAKGIERCVQVWTPSGFEAYTGSALQGVHPLSDQARKLNRFFSANSLDTELDSAGRVMVPAFLLERPGLPAPLYGFPDFGAGVKAAFHCHGALTDPAHVDRAIHAKNDIEPIRAAMEQWMPGASDTFLDARACMYSLTPDGHFVVDRHPEHPRLVLCGGFSGHGFKFAPVIGEIAADLAVDGNSRHDITFLSLQRFLLP